MPNLFCVAYFGAQLRLVYPVYHICNNFYVYYPIATKFADII